MASAWDVGDGPGLSETCYDEALVLAQQRKTFGWRSSTTRWYATKFMDMKMRIESTRAWLDAITARRMPMLGTGATGRPGEAGQISPPRGRGGSSALKNHATQTMQFCADQAVQILGGMGSCAAPVERIYREVKVMTIGGGPKKS